MRTLILLAGITFFLSDKNGEVFLENPSSPVKIICTYRLTFQPDSTSKDLKQENMILYVCDTISEFASLNKINRDSIMNRVKFNNKDNSTENATDKLAPILQAPKTKFTFRIHKFTREQKCLVYDNIGSDYFFYSENNFPLKWTLEQVTSTIAGYKCQKATTSFGGRKYEAWFTREIPVIDGPYKFSGLPGLIVKVYDSRKNYDFELIAVSKPTSKIFISIPAKSTFVPKEDFTRAAKASHANILNGIGPHGTTYVFSDDVKKRIQENQKRNNNPIELK